MALVKCIECGGNVSTQAAACPSCGAPPSASKIAAKHTGSLTRKIGRNEAFVLLVIGFAAIAWIASESRTDRDQQYSGQEAGVNGVTLGDPAPAAQSMQAAFESMRTAKLSLYNDARNEIQKSAVFNQANAETDSFIAKNGAHVDRWSGVIDHIITSHGGTDARVEIKSPGGAVYKINDAAPQGSKIYQQLSVLSNGQIVKFSGTIIQKDGKWEGSLTEFGSLKEPEFYMDFDSIEAL